VFRTVLIANRGEIACRIARTCRRMGIRGVAVFSDADQGALHTRTADAAIRIGPAEAARSYLNVEAIIAAARAAGADAVHPGYGFLSERAILPRRLTQAGIGWIGPHADAIESMGSKRAAKALARAAGVACVPGYDGAEQSDSRLADEAARIGFPLLIKASAGGGGRGMRRVDAPAELPAALSAARAEAQAAFGNAELLLEKLVLRPRHLEVQLAGDRHGNLVHLFERECSVQRNYQKVLEEAPAPNLPATVRAKLHESALRLGRAIGYDSLGTAEFILEDGTEDPWFLEMNVRLQVEHPVTEAITGLDLVEWQIRAAAGERLPVTQAEITQTGHAIEARLCAEDPAQAYRPGTGTILRFDPPQAAGLRADTGVEAGSEVTPHYDSLLAKLIAHGADRAKARDRLAGALDGLVALGVPTNQAFLADIVDQPAFRSGHLTTRFLEEAFPAGWHDQPSDAAELAAVAAWLAQAAEAATGPGPWATLGAFRLLAPSGRPARTDLSIDGIRELSVTGNPARFTADGQTVTAECRRGQVAIDLATGPQSFAWAAAPDTIWVQSGPRAQAIRITPAGGGATGTASAAGPRILAPMPGLITAIEVAEGQTVEAGQACVVMEAMKVVLRLPAPLAGRISRILCGPGEPVANGAILVEITPPG
jgi:acetyl/propionyl-CoA carboxylase alpha subunit